MSGWTWHGSVLDAAIESLAGIPRLTPYEAAKQLADFCEPFPDAMRPRFVVLGSDGLGFVAFVGSGHDDKDPEMKPIPYRISMIRPAAPNKPSWIMSPMPSEGFIEGLAARGAPLWQVGIEAIRWASQCHPHAVNGVPDVWVLPLKGEAHRLSADRLAPYWPPGLVLRSKRETWGEAWWRERIERIMQQRRELVRQKGGA